MFVAQPPQPQAHHTLGSEGARLGAYTLHRFLGAGGMAEVWEAFHDDSPGHPVALKIMAGRALSDPDFAQRFLVEASRHQQLRHPNIVSVLDFFVEQGYQCMVMERIEGFPLDRLIRENGRLPIPFALNVARDILMALDYAHQERLIHRDVKPSNILVDPSGRSYLTDFGIALMIGDARLTATGQTLGSPQYMSPEQISQPRKITHLTDVYSFGCVLYEMLAGRPPFLASSSDGDDSYFAIMRLHVEQKPEPLRTWNPEIPPLLDAVILTALAKKPQERMSGCGVFVRLLEDSLTAIGQSPNAPVNFSVLTPPPGPPTAEIPHAATRLDSRRRDAQPPGSDVLLAWISACVFFLVLTVLAPWREVRLMGALGCVAGIGGVVSQLHALLAWVSRRLSLGGKSPQQPRSAPPATPWIPVWNAIWFSRLLLNSQFEAARRGAAGAPVPGGFLISSFAAWALGLQLQAPVAALLPELAARVLMVVSVLGWFAILFVASSMRVVAALHSLARAGK